MRPEKLAGASSVGCYTPRETDGSSSVGWHMPRETDGPSSVGGHFKESQWLAGGLVGSTGCLYFGDYMVISLFSLSFGIWTEICG